MIHRNATVEIAIASLLICSAFTALPTSATYYEVFNCNGSTVVTSGGTNGMNVSGYTNAVDYLYAHETAAFGGIPLPPGYGYATQWLTTADFTSGYWTSANHTVREYSLPDSTAAIFTVYVVSVWQISHIPDCKMGFSINGGTNWTWGNFTSSSTIYAQTAITWNVTGLISWTPTILTSANLQVKIISYSYGVSPVVYCNLDYLGLVYYWSSANPPVEGEISLPSDGLGIFNLDVMGTMGAVGFIGMFAIIPAAIWFQRRDGGSKIIAGVTALLAFVLCLGLFLTAINY